MPHERGDLTVAAYQKHEERDLQPLPRSRGQGLRSLGHGSDAPSQGPGAGWRVRDGSWHRLGEPWQGPWRAWREVTAAWRVDAFGIIYI